MTTNRSEITAMWHRDTEWADAVGKMMPKDLPRDFPRGPVIKNLPSNVRDMGLIPGQTTRILQATTREACMPQQRPSTAKKKRLAWWRVATKLQSVKCAVSVRCDKRSYACVYSILTQVLDSLPRSAWVLSGAPLSSGGYKVDCGDPPPPASTTGCCQHPATLSQKELRYLRACLSPGVAHIGWLADIRKEDPALHVNLGQLGRVSHCHSSPLDRLRPSSWLHCSSRLPSVRFPHSLARVVPKSPFQLPSAQKFPSEPVSESPTLFNLHFTDEENRNSRRV